MVIIKREDNRSKLRIGSIILKQAEKSNYLGSLITQIGRFDEEIKRIGTAKNSFTKPKNIWKNKNLSSEIRKQMLDCYVLPILMYGCEA